MNKEVDKDLTMIQPEPEGAELAFEELLKNTPDTKVSVFDSMPANNTSQAMEQYNNLKKQQLVYSSPRPGEVDTLDANRGMDEDINSVRARNQSGIVKGAKALTGGLVQGGLIALEELGYVADVNTYLNMFRDAEDVSGNWWTNMIKDAQEDLRESTAFKIYEQAPSENSLASQVFKWTSLEGALSSAVGFGITGLGATKLVSWLGSTGKISQLGNLIDTSLGAKAAKLATEKALKAGATATAAEAAGVQAAQNLFGATRAFVGPLASSMTANYFMGQVMATDTYRKSMEELQPLIEEGKISDLEAQAISNTEAQDVVALNMLLTATAYIKFKNIFNRKTRIRGLVENPSSINQIKNLVVAGSPTAFTENVYQEMIQMEQLYDARKAMGGETPESDNYWDRMTNFALSNRALHAGALGIAGGPIQFAIIQRPFMAKQIKEQRDLYNKQQEQRGWHENFVANNFASFKQYEDNFNDAVKKGDIANAELISDMGFIETVANSVHDGTIGAFREDISKILKYTPEEAQENGYGEDYKEIAERLASVLQKAEGYARQVGSLANKAEIVRNMLFTDRVKEQMKTVMQERTEALESVQDYIKAKFPDAEVVFNPFDGKIAYKRDENRFEGMTEGEKAKLRISEKQQDEALKNIMNFNKDYTAFKKANNNLTKLYNFAEQLDKKFNEITSEEYIKNYEKTQQTKIDQVNAEISKGKAEFTEQGTQEEEADTNYTTQKLVADNNPLSQEEIDANISKWNSEGEFKKHALKDDSFSGLDYSGKPRVFTPDELVRSNDGRIFKVLAQNTVDRRGERVDPAKRSGNLPLLIEVDEAGNTVKEAKAFALTSLDFLRPESLLPIYKKNGERGFGYEKQWGTYVNPDSILKPFNLENQLARVDMAERGEISGVNIPASVMKGDNVEWLADYNQQLLDLPFDGEKEVIYKLNKKGDTEVYVDVYLVQDDGSELLLTRINREANLNYPVLVDLLTENKSEIRGKLIDHYSSNYNLLKHYDQDNNPVLFDLKDLTNLNPKYLLNGKLILAQNRGEGYAEPNVARYADGGDPILSDAIADEKTGEFYDIPYVNDYGENIMRPGITYALIKSPGNRLIPIPIQSKPLGEIASQMGNGTFADDFVDIWQNSIDSWVEKYIGDESKETQELLKKINNDQRIEAKDAMKELSKRKNELLWNLRRSDNENIKNAAINDVKEEVQKYIRLNWKKYSLQGTINGKDIYAKNEKNKKLVRENYFDVTVVASNTSGKFVPAIQMHNPNNKTIAKIINLEDHREEFMEVISKRPRRVSIEQLGSKEGDSRALMKDIIENQGLTIDIDPTQPFVGSSGTFKIDHPDFDNASLRIAEEKRVKINRRFKNVIKDRTDLKELIEKDREAQMQKIDETIEESIVPDSFFLSVAKDVETAQGVKDQFNGMLEGFDLRDISKAGQVLNEYLEAENPSILEGYAGYKEMFDQFADYSAEKRDVLARGFAAIDDISRGIKDGEYQIKRTRATYAEDASGKFTQPEGLTFDFGNQVYHTTHGDAKFLNQSSEGKYKLELARSKKIVYAFPEDVYRANGPRHNLAKVNKQLAKMDPANPQFKVLENQKKRHENMLAWITKQSEPAGAESRTTAETLEDRFRGSAVGTAQAAVAGLGTTERSTQIVRALATLEDYAENVERSESGVASPITEEMAKQANELIIKNIPYTRADLINLIEAAQDNWNENINTKLSATGVASFKSLENILTLLQSNPDVTKPLTTKIYRYNSSRNELIPGTISLPAMKASLQVEGGNAPRVSSADTYTTQIAVLKIVKLIESATAAEADLRAELFASKETQAESIPTVKAEEDKGSETPVEGQPEPAPKKRRVAVKTDYDNVIDFQQATLDIDGFAAAVARASGINKFREVYSTIPADKIQNVIDQLETAYGSPNAFKEVVRQIAIERSFDDLPFKRGEDTTATEEEFIEELKRIRTMLPQVPIHVVDSVGEMVKRYGTKAIGVFDMGVRTLVRNAKRGTGYHETFHAVADLYLTAEQKQAIAKENGAEKWTLDLEESLADRFEEYVNKKPIKKSLGRRIWDFFSSILDWFRGAPHHRVTEKIFENIVSNKYADSPSLRWQKNSNLIFNSVEGFKNSISEKNRVLLQKLLDDNKIEIVC